MFNAFALFKQLQPHSPLQAGEVVAVDADGDIVTVELPGGAYIRAKGAAQLGQQVFVRDGLVQGVASTLPRLDQEV